MANKRSRTSASLGCLFWIAFILLVLVLFFFNRKNISMVLEKTGAIDLVSGTVSPEKEPEVPGTPEIPTITTTDDTKPEAELLTPEKPAQKPAKPAETQPVVSEKPAASETVTNTTPAEKPVSKPPREKPAVQTRTAPLFFVTIDADGRVLRQEVKREVPRTDSPLSETLSALFAGTNGTERAKKLRTLIPEGTRLLSASVKDGVATINVSEEFQFNQYGIEGYLGQLAQVVFTATAFPTVSSVQILIEGQRREYLGAEGVWIGTPLSRDKF